MESPSTNGLCNARGLGKIAGLFLLLPLLLLLLLLLLLWVVVVIVAVFVANSRVQHDNLKFIFKTSL